MAPPPGPVDDLPVKATVGLAYRCVFSDLVGFARAAFLPLILSVVLAVPLGTLSEQPLLAFLFGVFAVAVPYTLFGVAWYRLILLGGAEPPPALFPKWQARHWRFFRYTLLLLLAGQGAVTLVASQVVGNLPVQGEPPQADPAAMLGSLVILIVVSVVMLRLSLVFPAVAVDETYSLAYAWRHTRRQGLRLLAASMLALFPLILAGWIVLAMILATTSGGAELGAEEAGATLGGGLGTQLALYIGENLISYLSFGVTMAIIAAAFRTCAGWIPGSGGPPNPIASIGAGEGEGES